MLDLTDLHYFATVAREGGVTRASENVIAVTCRLPFTVVASNRMLVNR